MQLGHPGHHDPQVMIGEERERNSTQRRKFYKYASKEQALAACKKKSELGKKGAAMQGCKSWQLEMFLGQKLPERERT